MCDTRQTIALDGGGGGDGVKAYSASATTLPIPCIEQNRACCKTDSCTQNKIQGPYCPCPEPRPSGDGVDPSASPHSLQPPQNGQCPVKEYDPCSNPCCHVPGNNPFCPPGQVIGILPPGFVQDSTSFPRPVQKPCAAPPPRLPWRQCVENYLINDQVRRPLARWCHLRPVPPIVLPSAELNRIRDKIDKSSRAQQECDEWRAQREQERQASYRRHSEWNYTVDSLLARKKEEEELKEKKLQEEYCQVSKAIRENRDRYSAEKIGRARQQLLFRKGLIRDFHAALAQSKSLKEMEDSKYQKQQNGIPKINGKCSQDIPHDDNQFKQDSPWVLDSCMKRMLLENNGRSTEEFRAAKKLDKCKKPPNPQLIKLLKCDENRVGERQAEIEKEKSKLKQLRVECPLLLPQSYLKSLEEPKTCEPDDADKKKLIDQDKLRQDLFLEIHDKLATDAFVESHEKEIERQACEYNEYKRRVDKIKIEKEKQLIEDKVAHNIKMSELAAAALIEARSKQQKRSNNYELLKQQWEEEYEEKFKNGGKGREALLQKVAQDYLCRKNYGCCKRAELDPAREWEKEQCYAVQNYEQQCEQDNSRREKAKEIAKYQMEQVADKIAREEEERRNNAAWGERARCNYACEMKEMKDYAYAQIKEWQDKGRPTFPMKHAMKKWDYEMGMTPFLYAQTACGPICKVVASEDAAIAKKNNCPSFDSTAQRLGFCQ